MAGSITRPHRDPVGAKTLELFAAADGYNRLVWRALDRFGPARGDVLEVGCGIGNLSRLILESPRVSSLHGIDPDEAYVDRFRAELDPARASASATAMEDFVPERFGEAADERYDTIVCSNVLEHLEDDVAALGAFRRLLRPGGLALVLVPAHPWLYSSLDRALSHYRRYRAADLAERARHVGLVPDRLRYFNPLAIAGWWWNGKVCRRDILPAGQLRAYARVALPLSAALDRINFLPLGISVIAALRRD